MRKHPCRAMLDFFPVETYPGCNGDSIWLINIQLLIEQYSKCGLPVDLYRAVSAAGFL